MTFSISSKQWFVGSFILVVALIVLSLISRDAMSKTATLDEKLDNLVNTFKAKIHTSGISVLVSKKGKIIYQNHVGLANIEHNIKVSKETVFPIGSLTKQFTGLAINQLVVAGKLSHDDELIKFFPDYPNGEKVTIRNLLNHTSGISNYTNDQKFNAQVWGEQTPEQMLAWFKDKPFLFEPGTRWNYTNSGTYLLGLIIEKVSKKTYSEYLKEHIFTPFKMDNTVVAGSAEIILNRASGYELTEKGYKNAIKMLKPMIHQSHILLVPSFPQPMIFGNF